MQGLSTLSWPLGFWSALSLSSVSLQLKLSMDVACVSYPFIHSCDVSVNIIQL